MSSKRFGNCRRRSSSVVADVCGQRDAVVEGNDADWPHGEEEDADDVCEVARSGRFWTGQRGFWTGQRGRTVPNSAVKIKDLFNLLV